MEDSRQDQSKGDILDDRKLEILLSVHQSQLSDKGANGGSTRAQFSLSLSLFHNCDKMSLQLPCRGAAVAL